MVDSLTTHGDDSTSAGVFAGDAGLSSLANQLDDIAHASYNGVSIVDYGITLDSHATYRLTPTSSTTKWRKILTV